MSPRIDHRPPVIAFLFLVVLAIAVVGTNARALDHVAIASDPLEVHAKVSGTALAASVGRSLTETVAQRVKPVSRSASRSADTVRTADAARTVRTAHTAYLGDAADRGKRLHRGWERKARHHVRRFVMRFLALGRSFRAH